MCAIAALTVLMDSRHHTVMIGSLKESMEVEPDSMTVLGNQKWKMQFQYPQQQPSRRYLFVSMELVEARLV